jgi:hypothetical protein
MIAVSPRQEPGGRISAASARTLSRDVKGGRRPAPLHLVPESWSGHRRIGACPVLRSRPPPHRGLV